MRPYNFLGGGKVALGGSPSNFHDFSTLTLAAFILATSRTEHGLEPLQGLIRENCSALPVCLGDFYKCFWANYRKLWRPNSQNGHPKW